MNGFAGLLALLLAALGAALWAGWLALAEESSAVTKTLEDDPGGPEGPVPLYRAVQIARVSLLTLAGIFAAVAVQWWERPPLQGLIVVLVALGFLYLVSDALPRMIASLSPDLSAAAVAGARRSLAMFRPLLGLVSAIERAVAWFIPARRLEPEDGDEMQRDLVLGLYSLSETEVADIMTPRLDITAVDESASWNELIESVRRSEHARLIVMRQTLDSVIGVLYAKDLLPAVSGVREAPERWQDLIRPVPVVPETKSLTDQVRDFQGHRGNIALVVDEFGGTSGLITLEDILEEVFGEILDEYDIAEEPAVEREGNDKFWVEGTVTLDELSALLETSLESEEISTVGGLVYSELGRVPTPGEEMRIGDFRVVVEKVYKRRVRRVYFERVGEDVSEPVSPADEVGT